MGTSTAYPTPRSRGSSGASTLLLPLAKDTSGRPTYVLESDGIVSVATYGANDAAEGILDTENWFEMRGRVTAISGGALATIVAGV